MNEDEERVAHDGHASEVELGRVARQLRHGVFCSIEQVDIFLTRRTVGRADNNQREHVGVLAVQKMSAEVNNA